MPVVKKQTFKPVKKASDSILDRIQSVADRPETGFKGCLYGRGKTGKTSLACDFPKKVLIIGTEDGTKSVRNLKGVDFVRLQRSEEINDLTLMLKEGEYESVILDTAGGLQDLLLKEFIGLSDVPLQKAYGMVKIQDWGSINGQTKEYLKMLLDLADSQGTNVLIIAHERNFDTDTTSDLIFPTVGAALSPGVAGWLNGACDYICQTFVQTGTITSTVTVGGKPKQVTKKGGIEYCLRIGLHPVYMTGFRVPRGISKAMPEFIVDPTYDKINQLIQGG